MGEAIAQGFSKVEIEPLPTHPTFVMSTITTLGVTRFRPYAESVANGPNVQVSPGWWPVSGTMPNPTAMRTNEPMADIKYVQSGVFRSCVRFKTTGMTATNADGKALVTRPGAVAYRYANLTTGFPLAWSAWKYAVPIQAGDGCTVITEELNPANQYLFWWVLNLPPDAEGMTSKWEVCRESGTERGQFWEIDAIGGDGTPAYGLFDPITSTNRGIFWIIPNDRYLVLGDSQNSCFLTPAVAEPTWVFRHPMGFILERHVGAGSPILSRLGWGERGALGGWAWRLMETKAALGTAGERHFEVINLSGPGRWLGRMGPVLRAFWEGYFPGFFPDYPDSFEYLLKGAQQWTAGGFWIHTPSTWAPDKVIIGTGGNDQVQGAAELRESTGESYFRGAAIKDAITKKTGGTSLIAKLRAKWAAVKVFGLLVPTADASWHASIDTKAQIIAGLDGSDAVNYHDAIGLGAGTDTWLYFDDIANLGTSIDPADYLGKAIHPTYLQHEEVRAARQTAFNAL